MTTYTNRKKKGLCVTCGLPIKNKSVRCDKCAENHKTYLRIWYRKEKIVDIRKMLRDIDATERI